MITIWPCPGLRLRCRARAGSPSTGNFHESWNCDITLPQKWQRLSSAIGPRQDQAEARLERVMSSFEIQV